MIVGVTGASGHLGNVVCRELLAAGHSVKAMYHKDDRALEGLEVEKYSGDILDSTAVDLFVEGCDIIIHSAAWISIHGDPTGQVFRTNTQGPQNIVNAVQKFGIKKLIHISSTHAVMEEPLNIPFDESRPYKQKGNFAYDFSKATGEQIVLKAIREGHISGLIIRPSAVVGPYDFKPSELGKALLDFYHRKIPTLPSGGYNFIDVRDIAKAIANALEKGSNGEVYLVSGAYFTIKDLASKITQITGIKTPKWVLPYWFLKAVLPLIKLYGKITKAAPVYTIESITALKLGHPNMDNSKAKKVLDLSCRNIDETIRDFYKWHNLAVTDAS